MPAADVMFGGLSVSTRIKRLPIIPRHRYTPAHSGVVIIVDFGSF
jgi:hypothetical protein